MEVLVVNAGSSSVKLGVVDAHGRVAGAVTLDAPRGRVDEAGLVDALEELPPADAVGHRIVHGGTRFAGPVRIDDAVVREIGALAELAPLHQPKSLQTLDAVGRALPDLPAVACFDTAFHATLPPAAATYAVPLDWRERFGVRRFGFHGLSHAYASRRAAEMVGRPLEALRVVTCHLGAGASLAAVAGGRSVDTTMGFTPLEGLVMATRSGSVDPGLLLWLLEHSAVGEDEMADLLEHASGMAALAGTADMRAVLARAARGEATAEAALDVYLHRLAGGVATMVAAMNGIDVLVFTGGVGENAPPIRARAAHRLAFLGVKLDATANATVGADRAIGVHEAAVTTLVVAAREDLEIARQVRDVLSVGG